MDCRYKHWFLKASKSQIKAKERGIVWWNQNIKKTSVEGSLNDQVGKKPSEKDSLNDQADKKPSEKDSLNDQVDPSQEIRTITQRSSRQKLKQ